MARGHYSVYAGDIEPCPEAEAKTKLVSKGGYRPEQQICDAIINEIERQRPSDSWGFVCCIDGEPISVSVASSGHCEAWLEQGYKRPTYQQEPEVIGNGISSTSSSTEKELSPQVISAGTVKSLTASTPLSSKFNPKIRLSARIQNRITKEWNELFLPRDSSPRKA